MATTFPTNIDSYTTKVNNVDTITAGHVNDLQDAMVQVETILGSGSARAIATFDPALEFSTTNPTSVTYDANTNGMYYSRFGGMVFVAGRINVTAYSGGSGNFRMTLPFNVINSVTVAGSHAMFSVRAISGFSTNIPAVGQVENNTNYLNLFAYSTTAAGAQVTQTNCSTGGFSLNFSGFYFHA
jgi:hypothetical protein